MGDFNGKVGNNKEKNVIGPYGLETRNGNGDRQVNFRNRHSLFVTNIWFQQKRSAYMDFTRQRTKNQTDFVLVDNWFRNVYRFQTDRKPKIARRCRGLIASDHNLVIAKDQITKGMKMEKY